MNGFGVSWRSGCMWMAGVMFAALVYYIYVYLPNVLR